MTTLQQRYEREHPWGEDDLRRAAGEHSETHGGVIAEASLETRVDTAGHDLMRAADDNDQGGGSVDFQDALDEEDQDLLADSKEGAKETEPRLRGWQARSLAGRIPAPPWQGRGH